MNEDTNDHDELAEAILSLPWHSRIIDKTFLNVSGFPVIQRSFGVFTSEGHEVSKADLMLAGDKRLEAMQKVWFALINSQNDRVVPKPRNPFRDPQTGQFFGKKQTVDE